METHPRIRIFLSSPGDLVNERSIVLKLLDELRYDSFIRKRAVIEAVAWDQGLPLVATLHPQEAINKGLAKPSECDIVFVLFWSRMGTPLPFPTYQKPDGTPYLSGTEWEYEDARRGWAERGTPDIYLYRRTEKVLFDEQDPDYPEKHAQYGRVEQFFRQFVTPEGAITASVNVYRDQDEFRTLFERHARAIILEKLSRFIERTQDAVPLWQGSPFPGLRAFTLKDAPIFFGREREIEALFSRVTTQPFSAVVGASGSGKSSLVSAGLIPRLRDTRRWLLPEMEGERWKWLRCTPAENPDPFLSLAGAFAALFDEPAETLAAALRRDSEAILTWFERARAKRQDCEQVLLVVDQFEELFSCQPADRAAFAVLIAKACQSAALRLVITLRADFYHRCLDELPQLTHLLESGTFPLGAPGFEVLYRMVERPAARAGLDFDPGLVEDILKDTGGEGDSLPLMAYALDLLYKAREGQTLKRSAYESFGGVKGAVGRQAEDAFSRLDAEAKAALPRVFRALTSVGNDQRDVRRRAPRAEIDRIKGGAALADALIGARLLTSSDAVDGSGKTQTTIAAAHEALFTHWKELARQLAADRAFRVWRQRLGGDVARWQQDAAPRPRFGGRLSYLYWGGRVDEARRYRSFFDELSPDERRFLQASSRATRALRLTSWLVILLMAAVSLGTAIYVGNQWRMRSAATTPDVAYFAAGKALLGDPPREVYVDSFGLERTEVSYRQYRLCVASGACSRPGETGEFTWYADAAEDMPVAQVSAYQAWDFCRWVGRRLPTAAEWERAARGMNGRTFPWGDTAPAPAHTNIPMAEFEVSPASPVAVNDSRFQQGATSEGLMHLFGNLAEWTSTPTDCADPYACEQEWDGVRPAALHTKGFSWLTPYESMTAQPLAESIPALTGFTFVADTGFRCAVTP
ncbi:MAG: SUMF1/EgtB/PvdO family nonheme iron enzyme [Anaerolineae bacterium]|nr:SUMF1/EgtB/PvdO family nonheme iron enzyme [Anaerolineae bacterium]NUQ06238.1 SUMF1/EgtB/PvdO family nonheme iron enzyme [Anaerolineae bacterium]